jgi:DNA-binding CsgD family transcriptional regulator
MIALLLLMPCAPESVDYSAVPTSRSELYVGVFSVIYQGQFSANTEQIGYLIEALSSVPQGRIINTKGEALLTPREEQVVSLAAEGIGNREVAQRLSIKENTVKKALLRIYDKLGVSNRVELVLYALTHRGVDEASPLPTSTAPAAEPLALGFVSVSPAGPCSPRPCVARPDRS